MNGGKKREEIDCLKRQKFVDMLIKLIKKIGEDHNGSTFAIDGVWGSGKTFVLDYFEEQIKEKEKDFIVLKYNCWKYDFYKEPLFAILANFITFFEKYNLNNNPEEETSKKMGEIFLSIGNDLVKKFAGINLSGVLEKCDSENISFDQYYKINEIIDKIRKELEKITTDHKIILIVDELDRCAPDYAIKVLERLHHITYDVKKVNVIIGIDGIQLEKTIQMVFGNKTDTEKYLRKFVDFTLKLDTGTLDENWVDIYKEYFELDNNVGGSPSIELVNIISSFLKELSAREQEKIFRKNKILYKIVSSELNLSSFDEFMSAFILIYLILNEYYIASFNTNQKFKWLIDGINSIDSVSATLSMTKFYKSDKSIPYKLLKEIENNALEKVFTRDSPSPIRFYKNNLWGKILLCLDELNSSKNRSTFEVRKNSRNHLNFNDIKEYSAFIEKVQCWASFL